MSDPIVDRWRKRGEIYLWRFPEDKRDPDWHCSADIEGCTSILELLRLMQGAKWSTKVPVKLTPPSPEIFAIPGFRFTKWQSPTHLTLQYPKGKVPDNFWQWTGDFKSPILAVGASKLEELISAFDSLLRLLGDFCVRAEDQEFHKFDFAKMGIWFW